MTGGERDVEAAVIRALRNDFVRSAFREDMRKVASEVMDSKLAIVGIDVNDDENVKAFRGYVEFVANLQRRCTKVWDRLGAIGISIVVSLFVGLLVLGISVVIPGFSVLTHLVWK